MKRRESTTPVFEAFAIGLKARTLAVQRAWLRTAARRLFPRGSYVEALDPATKGAKARTFTITPSAGPPLPSGVAWERARQLASQPIVRYAEPLFRAPGLEPDPRRVRTLLAPHERAKGSRSDGILPCAASNVLWSLELVRAPEAWALEPPDGGAQFGEGEIGRAHV